MRFSLNSEGKPPLLARVRALLRDPDLRTGARDMIGMSIGVAAWGMVTGVAMVKGGLSVGMAIFMFLGLEFVTPLAPELKRASRNIPRAMQLGLKKGPAAQERLRTLARRNALTNPRMIASNFLACSKRTWCSGTLV